MKKQIDLLLYMLDDIRKVTLKGVEGLTKDQLFAAPIEGEFSIGSYLMHLGECDLFWLYVISGEEQPEDLKKRVYSDVWYDSTPEKFNPPKSAPEPKEYVEAISAARDRLRNYVQSLEDENLEETIHRTFSWGERNYPRKWIIYHLIEHEAHHRGQMFMLIRKAGFKKKGENN